MRTITLASMLTLLGVAACATTPIPADKLSRATAAVRTAEEMNAASDPTAALHMQLAREQLQQGKKLLQDAENERAGMILERAEADANAAREIARAKSSRIEVEQTMSVVQQQKAGIGGSQ